MGNKGKGESGASVRPELDKTVSDLRGARDAWRRKHRTSRDAGSRDFPSRDAIKRIAGDLRSAIFPMRLGPGGLTEDGEDAFVRATLARALDELLIQVRLELLYFARNSRADSTVLETKAADIVGRFSAMLADIRVLLDSDVEAAFSGDPAARSVDEILMCYPGINAIIHYRLAHGLFALGASLVARMLSEIAHSDTGIDIHPGAVIGPSFFIDHGTGVVIGETAVIGARVTLYQAVTLGAKSFPIDANGRLRKGLARHPVIEDDVIIYAGATILGRITIGRGSKIGGNVWLTRAVPARHVVNQASVRQEIESNPLRLGVPGEAPAAAG